MTDPWRREPTLADLVPLAGAVGAAADVLEAVEPDALTAAGEALALLHAAPSAEPARSRACLRLAVLRLAAVEAAARRAEQQAEIVDLVRLALHPRRGEAVECTLQDGSRGYAPAVLAELVDDMAAVHPETSARLRRALGNNLLQLWGEGKRRADSDAPPFVGDPFTDCVRAARDRRSSQ